MRLKQQIKITQIKKKQIKITQIKKIFKTL